MKIFQRIHKQHNKKNGFTITEVIVAAIIFSLAMAGVFASVSELRQPAVESTEEVAAAFVGKKVLEDLREQVSQATWNSTGNLMIGNTYVLNAYNVGGKAYTPTYYVELDPNGTSARKVTLNVTW